MNLRYIDILNIKGSNYRCIISGISKNKAINIMQDADVEDVDVEKVLVSKVV